MMKNIKKKITIFIVAFAMILPLSLATVLATGEEFQYNLNYVLSEDKTYATITLALLPTTDIQYTSITDVHNNEEHLNSTNETITRDYKVTSNKDYSLKVKYTKQSGDEQSQDLKLTITGIETIQPRNTARTVTEGAYTINDEGTITNINVDLLTDKVDIVIPDTVGSITVTGIAGNDSDNVFSVYYPDVESITLPSTLKTIGVYAFSECRKLSSITLPEGLTTIKKRAFSYCHELKNITIPNSVKEIGDHAFEGSSLETISLSNGLTKIEDYVFYQCENLKNITIPNSVTSIGTGAFDRCYALENIVIPDSVSEIGSWAFEYCESLKNIKLPSELTSVEEKTFLNCSNLESVDLPKGITNIKSSAFYGCGFMSIDLSDDITSIGNSAFNRCSNLESIDIPKNVTSIENNTFYNCSKLKNINIPEGIKSINNWAFVNCTSLTEIKLPVGLTNLGISAFEGCTNLTEIRIPEGVTSIQGDDWGGTFKDCTQLTNVIMSDKMETITEYAFSGCTSLEKVMILSEKDDYDDHMNDLIQTINDSSNRTVTKYLGHTLLEVRQEKVSSYGEKVYDLDDLIYTPTVYKYEDDGVTKSVSYDFDLPSEYTLVKKSKSNDTRLDVANKKLYIGANENSIMTLSATYEGNTVSTQIEATPIVAESLVVKTNPTQLEYLDGDTFNPDGLQIIVTYTNGEIKTVDYQDEKENFSFDLTKLKTGDNAVKVIYQGKEIIINIKTLRQPILADANKNVIEGIKESYSKDATVSFQAKGDQQDNFDPVKGDTRYIPLYWKVNEIENFNKDSKATLLASSTGKQTLTVTFQLEEYDGSKWVVKGTDVKEKTFTVNETVHIDGPDTSGNDNHTSTNDSNIPSKDKNIYFHLNRTENGIIYDENGNRVDKYGNIIQTSDETSLFIYLGMIALSGCAVILIRKKYYK